MSWHFDREGSELLELHVLKTPKDLETVRWRKTRVYEFLKNRKMQVEFLYVI